MIYNNEKLMEELQAESDKINNESIFKISDKVKIINYCNRNYINQEGKISSRKDFSGNRVVMLDNGEIKQFQEDEFIKL